MPFLKSGTKPLPFPEKPIFKYNDDEEKETYYKKQEVENQRLQAQIYFNNWYRSAKKHFEKK